MKKLKIEVQGMALMDLMDRGLSLALIMKKLWVEICRLKETKNNYYFIKKIHTQKKENRKKPSFLGVFYFLFVCLN